MDKLYLSIIWWNTSLSPPTTQKVKANGNLSIDDRRRVCAQVIQNFISLGYEFICLGEVSNDDITFLAQELKLNTSDYTYVSGSQKVGKLVFDTLVIYRNTHELITYPNPVENLVYGVSGRSTKVAQRYEFNFSFKKDPIVLYVSHWSSQQSTDDKLYSSIAQDLRNAVNKDLLLKKNIILLGDYNVEPFHQSMVFNLQASREKGLVMFRRNLFYNPCWKFLSLTQSSKNPCILGTYYLRKSGLLNDWHMIDQILLSSHFFNKKWKFEDDLVEIVDTNLLMTDSISDHMAISMLIERVI